MTRGAAALANLDTPEETRPPATAKGLAAGAIAPPPAKSRVPVWLKDAVLRGLEIDPRDRWPSLDDFLAFVDRRLAVKRRGGFVAASAAAAVMAVAGFAAWEHSRAQLCSGGERILAGAWDDDVRGKIDRTFRSVNASAGKDLSARVANVLDGYRADWLKMHREACAATRIRGEQSDALLALRMACLDHREHELRSLTALLATADKKMANQAIDAAHGLSAINDCANISALTCNAPMPTEPGRAKNARDAQSQLAEANALYLAGRYPQALEKTSRIWPVAQSSGHRPTEASTLYLRGILEERTGKVKEAEGTLSDALFLAGSGADDTTKAMAATQLVFLTGQESRIDDGRRWERASHAAIERLGGNLELEANLLANSAMLLMAEGKYADAVDVLHRALELSEQVHGTNHPQRAILLANAGNALAFAEKADAAIPVLEDALKAITALRGPEHPTHYAPTFSLAYAYLVKKDFVKAHAFADEALRIGKTAYGAEHPRIAQALDLKASIFQEQKAFAEGLATYAADLEIKRKVLPKDSFEFAFSLDGEGHCLLGLGRTREAVTRFEEALAGRGPDPQGSPRRAMGSRRRSGASESIAPGRRHSRRRPRPITARRRSRRRPTMSKRGSPA